jgi:hypothetical protein
MSHPVIYSHQPTLVTTRARYSFTGELVELRGFLYAGPVAWCGPSAQQQQIAAQQQQFYTTMTQDYATQFAGQQNILKSLQNSFDPVLQAGINQYGFSAPETAALQSQATQGTAAQYANASRALNEGIAARGGTSFIPSGGVQQMQASVANAAAAQESNQLLGIQQAGYAQGTQNYLAAANALGNAAGMMNPTGYATAANNSGNAAYSSAYANQQMQNQEWSQIGGIVGGAAMNILAPGLGTFSMMNGGGGSGGASGSGGDYASELG